MDIDVYVLVILAFLLLLWLSTVKYRILFLLVNYAVTEIVK